MKINTAWYVVEQYQNRRRKIFHDDNGGDDDCHGDDRHHDDDDGECVSEVVRGLKEGQFQWDWIPPGPHHHHPTNAPTIGMMTTMMMFGLVIRILLLDIYDLIDVIMMYL